MNYKFIVSFNYLEERSFQSLAELHTRMCAICDKQKIRTCLFGNRWNLYLNVRMKSFTCRECVERITELQITSNEVLWQLQNWKTKEP